LSMEIEAMASEIPPPDSVPPTGDPDPRPGDPKPNAPPHEDDNGRRIVPVELPGKTHAPERVSPSGEAAISRA
jgi:hypothetical protein